MRSLLVIAGLSVAAFLAAASAASALTFARCGRPGAIRCATVTVPLDRTGTAAGTVSLHVERVAATHAATRPPLLALAGGPGDQASATTLRLADRLAAGLRDRDLIVLDQRGVGRSGALHCAGVDAGQLASTALPACAAQLGASAGDYTSVDSAEDIEAVRAALGVPQLALYGNSYGTWVAQVYARRHPDRVERLVLDSAISPGDIADAFDLRPLRRLPGLLRALCSGRSCRGLTGDLARDTFELLDRMDRRAIPARYFDASGSARQTSLTRLGTLVALQQLDLRPNMRAELPRAVSAARHGSPALLARLVAGQGPAATGKPGIGNRTILEVTSCEEKGFPWDRTASTEQRVAQARAALNALPASAFAPLGRDLAFLDSFASDCAYWPARSSPPDFGGPLPAVPALVLTGEADLRTPRENADEAAASLPGSQVLEVPNVGHATLQGDTTGCARRAVGAFLAGGHAAGCRRAPDPYAPRPLPPRSVRAAGGPVKAALATVDDALDQADAGIFNLDGRTAGGGLYGGSYSRPGSRLSLAGYQYVRGLKVGGTVPRRGPARLTLSGAVSAKLVFSSSGRVSGTIGRRAVHGRARLERRTAGEINTARFGIPPLTP